MQAPYRIIPAPLRKIIIRLWPGLGIGRIHRVWRRADDHPWPPPEGGADLPLEHYEYSMWSQNGEDGIVRYLFSRIGFRSRLFLEIGFSTNENNSLRLVLHERFGGVFIDSAAVNVRLFNKAAQVEGLTNVKAIRAFLDLDNLAPVIARAGLPPEIDFMSIDVDGNDYWFWRAITTPVARVVVVEYNASFGPDLSVTVPYDPAFSPGKYHPSGYYHGASLRALARLGEEKGYRLAGCDSQGVNAFFVRRDCMLPSIPGPAPQQAYRPNRARIRAGHSPAAQLAVIQNLPLVAV